MFEEYLYLKKNNPNVVINNYALINFKEFSIALLGLELFKLFPVDINIDVLKNVSCVAKRIKPYIEKLKQK